jgi:OOP family OmpA-OmpF porin
MATNLVETLKSQFTPELLQQLSAVVGESPARTQEAVGGAIPTLLAGLTNLASSEDGATQLANLLGQGRYGNLLNNFSSLLGGGNATQGLLSSGRDILGTLFGGKLSAVVDVVANASGIKNASASSLLSLLTPLVLGMLGREQAAQGLSAAGLVRLLMGQKDVIAKWAPAGLAGVLGVNNLANPGGGLASTATRVGAYTAPRAVSETWREGSAWWKWALPVLGLVVLGLLYSLWRGGSEGRREAVSFPARAAASITLPGGTTLSLPEGSLNYNLARFLATPSDTAVPKTFVFDNLNFESGTARLTAESGQTVNNLLAILKVYPAAEVRLEGHTDNTGEAETNTQLSLARAEAVKEALAKGGIAASRITTAGYGPEKPVASNETEEGRAKNRL